MNPALLRRRIFSFIPILLICGMAGSLQGGQAGRGATSRPTRQATPPSGSGQSSPSVLNITGAVIQEDGMPPPPGTRVECVCSARTKRSVPVDSRGFFSLQIGATTRYSTLSPDSNDETTDPTDLPPNRAGRRFGVPTWADSVSSTGETGCELRAVLSAFRSSTVVFQGVKNLGQFDAGTIVISPASKVPGTLVSVVSLQAPKEARKALARAGKSLQKKDIGKAREQLKSAIQIYPKYAEAWFVLGETYEFEGLAKEARDAYERSLAADSNYMKPYIALARMAGRERRWKDVADITDHALSLDPLDFPEAHYLNSLAYLNLSMLENSERSARNALRLDPLHRLPAAYLVLADILEQRLDLAGSIEQLRIYLQVFPGSPSADQVRARIKELEESLQKGE